MAAIMRRGPRPKGKDPITNHYVDDAGRRYRVCKYGARPIIVALRSRKATGGIERPLDIDGRRARQIIRKLESAS